MKRVISIILILVFLTLASGCKRIIPEDDYGWIQISEFIYIVEVHGEVGLLKKQSRDTADGGWESWGDDIIIVQGHFVCYARIMDDLILCKENEGNVSFWAYNIKTDDLVRFSYYQDLCEKYNREQFEWTKLWGPDEEFELIQKEFSIDKLKKIGLRDQKRRSF